MTVKELFIEFSPTQASILLPFKTGVRYRHSNFIFEGALAPLSEGFGDTSMTDRLNNAASTWKHTSTMSSLTADRIDEALQSDFFTIGIKVARSRLNESVPGRVVTSIRANEQFADCDGAIVLWPRRQTS